MPTGCDVVIARENRHNAMFVLGTRPRELIIESSREHERNEREHTRLSTLLTQRGIVDLKSTQDQRPNETRVSSYSPTLDVCWIVNVELLFILYPETAPAFSHVGIPV